MLKKIDNSYFKYNVIVQLIIWRLIHKGLWKTLSKNKKFIIRYYQIILHNLLIQINLFIFPNDKDL